MIFVASSAYRNMLLLLVSAVYPLQPWSHQHIENVSCLVLPRRFTDTYALIQSFS